MDPELRIEEKHLMSLVDVLIDDCSNWKQIGRGLGITNNDLDEILENVSTRSNNERLYEVLRKSQRTGELTIKKLLTTLKMKSVGISRNVIENFEKWNPVTFSEESDTPTTTSSSATSSLPTKQDNPPKDTYTHRLKTMWKKFKPSISANKIIGRKVKIFLAILVAICVLISIKILILLYLCLYGFLKTWLTSKPTFNPFPLPALNLPSLVGRENDTQTAAQFLLNGRYNALSIVGPPGVGKSAFAIAIGQICSRQMEVMYIDMIKIEDLEQYMTNKMEKNDKWINEISASTLLILDNCDLHTSGYKLNNLKKQIRMLVNKANNLKLVMTNQVEVLWGINKMNKISLQYLNLNDAETLLKRRFQNYSNYDDLMMLQEIVDGMPLAIENIATFIANFDNVNTGLEYLKPNVMKGPQKTLLDKLYYKDKYFDYTSHTVIKSIAIAHDKIHEEDNCGEQLVRTFGKSLFNKAEANSAITSEQHDYSNCINNLLQAQLLITEIETIQDVKEPGCMIYKTEFTILCHNNQSSRAMYRFHPLVAEYIIQAPKTKQRAKRESQTLMNKSKQGQYEHFVKNARKRLYCPHQYIFLNCSLAWNEATKGMLKSMMKHTTSVSERIEIGVRAVYWGRVIFKNTERLSSNDHKEVSKFIESSIQQISKKKDYENKADQLAAYVYYNHASLEITWESKMGQLQCFCPNANKSVLLLGSKEMYVDSLYSEISNNHLAWSASRSFYLDLECCCRVFGECEHRWKYWIKGIVSQVATARMYFQNSTRNRCGYNVEHFPPKVPTIIEGLWHYAFTKQTETAVTLLNGYLNDKVNNCPLLKIAAVMILHELYHHSEKEHLDKSLGQYIKHSQKLIDTNINLAVYREIIIPFMYEIGQLAVAEEFTYQLNSLQHSETNQEESFECTLLHQYHQKNFKDFFCLTL